MSSTTTQEGIETCARLYLGSSSSPLFVKGSWFSDHFCLYISDGLHCWTCNASEKVVAERAAGWDESVPEYLQRAQFYLSHQHPDSTYTFVADGENRKISWTVEKHGTKLEGKWRCQKADNDEEINCNILNFLMDSNVKLSDEVLRKTQSFERMKVEAEKCLKQSEQFKNEKLQFETDIFKKFVAVLNAKKSKLRELRDRLAKFEPAGKQSGDEAEDTDDEESEADSSGSEGRDVRAESHNASGEPDTTEKPKSKHTNSEEAKGPDSDMAKEKSPQRQSSRLQNSPRRSPSRHGSEAGPSEDATSRDVDSTAELLADSAYTSAPKRRRRL